MATWENVFLQHTEQIFSLHELFNIKTIYKCSDVELLVIYQKCTINQALCWLFGDVISSSEQPYGVGIIILIWQRGNGDSESICSMLNFSQFLSGVAKIQY